MKAWLFELLIRLLIRYFDHDGEIPEIDKEKVHNFLSTVYTHPHAELYFKYREAAFRHALSGGVGMKEVRREDYIRMIGQRFEAFTFYRKARKAYELRKDTMRKAHEARQRKNNPQP